MRGRPPRWAHDHAGTGGAGRVNQKARTRAAIVAAARDLARGGAEITMPAVAQAALVSEATAYRYFPDLVSLLLEADESIWPEPGRGAGPGRGQRRPGRAGRLRGRGAAAPACWPARARSGP